MESLETYDAVLKALTMMKRLKKLEGTLLIHEGILLHADTLLLESQEKAFVREVNALISQYRNADRPLGRAMLGFDGGNILIFHASPFVMCLIYGNVEDTEMIETAGEAFLNRWSDSLGLKERDLGDREPLDVEAAKASALKNSRESEMHTAPIKVPIKPAEIPKSKPTKQVKEPEAVIEKVDTSAVIEEPAQGSESSAASQGESSRELWNDYREKVENLLAKVLGRGQSSRFMKRELISMGITGDAYLTQNQFRPFGQKLTLRVKDKAIRKQLDTELLAILEQFTQ